MVQQLRANTVSHYERMAIMQYCVVTTTNDHEPACAASYCQAAASNLMHTFQLCLVLALQYCW